MNLDFLVEYPQYVTLLGVGMLWISLHCAGMCGPIVLGLDLGESIALENAGLPRTKRVLRSSAHLATYQFGRMIVYAIFGALAGIGGVALQELFRSFTRAAGFVVAGALILFGLARLLGYKRLDNTVGSGASKKALAKLAAWAKRRRGLKQKLLLGMILAFLPCMITFWALGLAASTQSPLHGAAIMVLLVAMTSGVIFGFGILPGFAPQRFHELRDRLLSIFIVLSGLWLGLISAAANEWIAHASISFTIHGKGYTIMFW